MFRYLEALNHKSSILLGLAAALSFFVPRVRQGGAAVWRAVQVFFTAPGMIREIRADLKTVKAQVTSNGGGSIKDAVARLEGSFGRQEAFRRHDFWTKGRPAMEMDGRGQVSNVSEALCQLFHVSAPQELYRRSWVRFMDSERADDWLRSFIRTAESDSIFRYEVEIYDSHRVFRGTWEFRASPIKPDIANEKLYSGHWTPVDDVAAEIAQRNRWAN